MALLISAPRSVFANVASYVMYSTFRSFLFRFIHAGISSELGFRYFGILVGIAYAISGLLQFLFMEPLVLWLRGTCHDAYYAELPALDPSLADCSPQRWETIHWIQAGTLALLLLVPFPHETQEKRRQNITGLREPMRTQERMPSQEVVSCELAAHDDVSLISTRNETSYGSIEESGSDELDPFDVIETQVHTHGTSARII